ncbi:MAG: EcsC family protein [Clostridium sp.]|nr:EcsC family protein [Clostridium sp.]
MINVKHQKIINKQLKKLSKAEKKLTEHKKDNIIKKKVNPYINKIEDKIPEKLQSTLETAFKKGFQLIFEKGTDIIEKSYNKDKINLDFDVNNYAVDKHLTKKNIKKVDVSANSKIILNKTISIVEGSALGILGIGLPDIPIFIGLLLKSIYEISLSYGFNYENDNEKAYILNIISGAVTKDEVRKKYLDTADQIAFNIDNNLSVSYSLDALLDETSKNMATSLLTAKFIQGLPIIGVIGGLTNFSAINTISKIAKIKYKKRYLNTKK